MTLLKVLPVVALISRAGTCLLMHRWQGCPGGPYVRCKQPGLNWLSIGTRASARVTPEDTLNGQLWDVFPMPAWAQLQFLITAASTCGRFSSTSAMASATLLA